MPTIIRTALLCVLTTFSIFSHAEPEISCPPALVPPNQQAIMNMAINAKDHGFLWKISKQGHTSYLYGTIHVAKFDWIFPGPVIRQALGQSDTMALEMDILNEDIQTRIKNGMATMQSNPIPDELVNQLKQLAKSECVPYEALARMTPEFQVATLQSVMARRYQLEAAYAIDGVLAGWGHNMKKTVVSLETPEMQLALMQMKSPQETIAFVEDNLNEFRSDRFGKGLTHISEAWVKSDYDDMSRYTEWCGCLKTELEINFMKRLLDDRNADLAKHIGALHESGKQVFAAVGSLHMFGPLGLPALMTQHGYTVERVDFHKP